MKARIVDGKAAKVMGAAKLALLPPHLQAEFIDAPDGTEVGDLFDGVNFTKPPAPLPTQKDYETAIQALLDAGAQTKNYDNIVSACSYAGYANAFQTEAIAFGTWRSAVWQYCYDQLALVLGGQRTQPTVAEFTAEVEAAVPLVLP